MQYHLLSLSFIEENETQHYHMTLFDVTLIIGDKAGLDLKVYGACPGIPFYLSLF